MSGDGNYAKMSTDAPPQQFPRRSRMRPSQQLLPSECQRLDHGVIDVRP
jgi:hypothetical protein